MGKISKEEKEEPREEIIANDSGRTKTKEEEIVNSLTENLIIKIIEAKVKDE